MLKQCWIANVWCLGAVCEDVKVFLYLRFTGWTNGLVINYSRGRDKDDRVYRGKWWLVLHLNLCFLKPCLWIIPWPLLRTSNHPWNVILIVSSSVLFTGEKFHQESNRFVKWNILLRKRFVSDENYTKFSSLNMFLVSDLFFWSILASLKKIWLGANEVLLGYKTGCSLERINGLIP